MTNLVPYLSFDGDCRAAMEHYHSILGGSLDVQTFGEAPVDSTPETADRVMHAVLSSDAMVMMASDTMPGMPWNQGNNIALSIIGPDEEKLTRYFDALAEGGSVMMPLEKQFWGDVFGMCTDKFGVHWMVNVGEMRPA